MRYASSAMLRTMQIEEEVAMKTVKTVFSVGREMKQSTRLGHGHWSHCTSRGIWKPSYITYRAYLERAETGIMVWGEQISNIAGRDQLRSYMNPPSNNRRNTRLQAYVHQRAPAIGSRRFLRVSSSSSWPLLLRMPTLPELCGTGWQHMTQQFMTWQNISGQKRWHSR